MSKLQKDKKVNPPPSPVKEKKPVTIASVWPILFIFLLLGIFTIHLLVFSDTATLLEVRDKELFLSLMKTRCLKLGGLLLWVAATLVFVLSSVPLRLLSIISSTLLWLLLFFYAGELYLSLYPPSQGNGEAYISKIWFKRYWENNKYGFRDKEYDLDELRYINTKDLLLFVGDSYVAGHGIKDPEKRTAAILDHSLKSDFFTIISGINGIGTLRESNIIQRFPLKPKVVILSHVSNDIEEILPPEDSYSSIYQQVETNFSRFLYTHSRNSVLGDLLYHLTKQMQYGKMQQAAPEKTTSPPPKSALYEWYKVDTLFNQHLKHLKGISDYVIDKLDAKFILVIYPEAGGKEIDSTDIYINQKIIQSLPKRDHLYIINTTPLFRPFSPSDRIVNALDGHPSETINRLVADTLIRLITSPDFRNTPNPEP